MDRAIEMKEEAAKRNLNVMYLFIYFLVCFNESAYIISLFSHLRPVGL
jgi:hypothetical protein